MKDYNLRQTGEPEKFETGAQRDSSKGKGMPHLISPHMLRRLAVLLEKGAVHYGARNWEKGIKYSRCIDSLQRHLWAFMLGDETEDHLAAVIFNAQCLIHFDEIGRTDLDDRPCRNLNTCDPTKPNQAPSPKGIPWLNKCRRTKDLLEARIPEGFEFSSVGKNELGEPVLFFEKKS